VGKQRKDRLKNLVKALDDNLFEGEAVLDLGAVDDLLLEELEELLEPVDSHQLRIAQIFLLGDPN
jgi:hypothetical protein